MSTDFYRKLVDLYAGGELPPALEEEMEQAGIVDLELGHELRTMRETVEALREDAGPEFTEEVYQRILMKMYARGAVIETTSPEPTHFQYQLPIQS